MSRILESIFKQGKPSMLKDYQKKQIINLANKMSKELYIKSPAIKNEKQQEMTDLIQQTTNIVKDFYENFKQGIIDLTIQNLNGVEEKWKEFIIQVFISKQKQAKRISDIEKKFQKIRIEYNQKYDKIILDIDVKKKENFAKLSNMTNTINTIIENKQKQMKDVALKYNTIKTKFIRKSRRIFDETSQSINLHLQSQGSQHSESQNSNHSGPGINGKLQQIKVAFGNVIRDHQKEQQQDMKSFKTIRKYFLKVFDQLKEIEMIDQQQQPKQQHFMKSQKTKK